MRSFSDNPERSLGLLGLWAENFVIDLLYSTFVDGEFIETGPANGRRLTLSRIT